MLAIAPPRPGFLAPLVPIVLAALTAVATWALTRPRHEAFSAFGAVHRAYCDADHDRFLPNALQHDAWGNPYMFQCNTHGFTIVSAGEDGVYDTADDARSDR